MNNIVSHAALAPKRGPSVDSASAPANSPRTVGDGVSAAARQFEAIFLRQMIASMRSPSLGEDLFGSDASTQFRDMSDARLADSMAGKFGIAALLERQLSK